MPSAETLLSAGGQAKAVSSCLEWWAKSTRSDHEGVLPAAWHSPHHRTTAHHIAWAATAILNGNGAILGCRDQKGGCQDALRSAHRNARWHSPAMQQHTQRMRSAMQPILAKATAVGLGSVDEVIDRSTLLFFVLLRSKLLGYLRTAHRSSLLEDQIACSCLVEAAASLQNNRGWLVCHCLQLACH